MISTQSASSARELVDLIQQNPIGLEPRRDRIDWTHCLSRLMDNHAEVRKRVYWHLENSSDPDVIALFATAVCESPDEEGFWVLFELEKNCGQRFITNQMIERLLTEWIPVEESSSHYNVEPLPAADLRRRLLATVTDGGPADIGARYLNEIEDLRDYFGIAELEPRHPDLASGLVWPIRRA